MHGPLQVCFRLDYVEQGGLVYGSIAAVDGAAVPAPYPVTEADMVTALLCVPRRQFPLSAGLACVITCLDGSSMIMRAYLVC